MENEWEETTLMIELPNLDHRKQTESYIQIMGLSTDKPYVKINNQLYTGTMINTLGSQLFLEVDENTGKDSASKKKAIKSKIVTDRSLKLDPIYLEKRTDLDPSTSTKT